MKQFFPILLLLSASPLPSVAVEPQIGSGETDGYKLVWQDLFDAEELNPDRWLIQINGGGGGNNELQFYTDRPENVRLGDDGEGNHCLILTAKREEMYGRAFTSGRISSKKRTAFTHGKVEASIKLPKTANGLWPAFWMMGNDYDKVGWPRCGEIDILEMGHADGIHVGTSDRYFNGAAHWGPQWPNASYAKASTKTYSLQDGQFHLFTLLWDENKLRMYVDLDKYPVQNPYYELNCPMDDPENDWSAGNYFHKDNFILFNLAVGGNFPNIHEADKITALNDDNNHEASMYVNYVKIYQKGLPSDSVSALTESDIEPDNSGIEILPGMPAVAQTITYDGDTIISQGRTLNLFSTTGIRVADSGCGEISTSKISPGIYLATDGISTRKIFVGIK